MTSAQRSFSKITDEVAAWSNIRQLIRGGSDGTLVPVVIPTDKRGLGWLVMFLVGLYFVGVAVLGGAVSAIIAWLAAAVAVVIAAVMLWRGSIVEIEQGTTGIRSRYGAFVDTLSPAGTTCGGPGTRWSSSSTRPRRSPTTLRARS